MFVDGNFLAFALVNVQIVQLASYKVGSDNLVAVLHKADLRRVVGKLEVLFFVAAVKFVTGEPQLTCKRVAIGREVGVGSCDVQSVAENVQPRKLSRCGVAAVIELGNDRFGMIAHILFDLVGFFRRRFVGAVLNFEKLFDIRTTLPTRGASVTSV